MLQDDTSADHERLYYLHLPIYHFDLHLSISNASRGLRVETGSGGLSTIRELRGLRDAVPVIPTPGSCYVFALISLQKLLLLCV
jgi:hypothetical protein